MNPFFLVLNIGRKFSFRLQSTDQSKICLFFKNLKKKTPAFVTGASLILSVKTNLIV